VVQHASSSTAEDWGDPKQPELADIEMARLDLGCLRASHLRTSTSSAMLSTDGGTTTPSILAVCWLMTSSNFAVPADYLSA
jgi:hypothetical protein